MKAASQGSVGYVAFDFRLRAFSGISLIPLWNGEPSIRTSKAITLERNVLQVGKFQLGSVFSRLSYDRQHHSILES